MPMKKLLNIHNRIATMVTNVLRIETTATHVLPGNGVRLPTNLTFSRSHNSLVPSYPSRSHNYFVPIANSGFPVSNIFGSSRFLCSSTTMSDRDRETVKMIREIITGFNSQLEKIEKDICRMNVILEINKEDISMLKSNMIDSVLAEKDSEIASLNLKIEELEAELYKKENKVGSLELVLSKSYEDIAELVEENKELRSGRGVGGNV